MGKHQNDPQKRTFFIKPETLHKIVRLTKFPALMLTISCSALLLTIAINQLPSFFTLTIPDHECTFLNLSLDDQHHLEDLLQEKTKSVSIFNGVEQLGRELLTEMPALANVTCSLDRDKKLHVMVTGKTLGSAPQEATITHSALTTSATIPAIQKPMTVAITEPEDTPFNELLSTHEQPQPLAFAQQPASRPYSTSLLSQEPPSFNPEILVSGKRN